ncbi:hypothetical protein SERLADRAFT_366694 [Serpula lacrymans var. lacrymans S7.9]|uniref:Zn(2)-C6 fungal-type domain-containing protein n=1 Tax=Serpula lacrymans var. lacrymans (strain S7.9) TaxID=578457 RepID=F8NPF8_SERL9|nr:uncharacterized protein SERLADRAFT_366694 [Serpula lacrymans var. lacrymans S7.9]EGO27168.1 hypothetical protein SERLADRAFT_366694 [Serpula lacrymans var. lacrymans S7.9]
MPKVPTAPSSRPALRRNQACRACRKRKLKCDAARPHCGTCVKQWQSLTSVPAPVGYAHPAEPQCIYDPVEGLTLTPDTDPMEKIRLLEEEVFQLKSKLQERTIASRSTSPQHLSTQHRTYNQSLHSSNYSLSPAGSQLSDPVHSSASPDIYVGRVSSAECPEVGYRNEKNSPEVLGIGSKSNADSFMDLLFSGWNPDLPEPHVLDHYIDVFFKSDPCGSRILHRSSFLSAMRLPPRDPAFPHSAILHAICASASRWSSRNVTLMPDGSRQDQFAEFHASKTRQYIDKTMATGEDIFPVVQACVLLAWYFYQEGRWVEVWIFAGFQTRVAVPLRLNYPGTFSTQGYSFSGGYLPPPKDFRDLESRRRTWWMTIIFDRIVSFGGWLHAIDERDLGTELPVRGQDFEAEQPIPSNPQDMSREDIFTSHFPRYTDPFLLLIKAIMLFGRVTDFNVRSNMGAPTAPSKNQNPYMLQGFGELDDLVYSNFLGNLPQMYRNNYGVTDAPSGSALDTDLYMVHIIPHAASITLHSPYLDFNDMQRTSTDRCVSATQSILTAYYMLSATSLDITRLHPTIVVCWYLAAVIQVQFCKHLIEINDRDREAEVWGEINVLRQAMLNYGSRSPIGTRQEKLLQGLMKEIVRLTSQRQPLEVGLPLFPFSHASVFSEPLAVHSDRMTKQPHVGDIPSGLTIAPSHSVAWSLDDINDQRSGINFEISPPSQWRYS